MLVACGAPAPSAAPASPARVPLPTRPARDRAPVDPLPLLAPEGAPAAMVAPAAIALELGGAVIEAPPPAAPISIAIVETVGDRVRAGIRLPHVRFAAWTHRRHLLAALVRDVRSTGVALRAGTFVTRLEETKDRVRVRYSGRIEIETWVSPADLALTTRTRTATRFTPGKPLHAMPGMIIRAAPSWTSAQLAVMTQPLGLVELRDHPDGWKEVVYEDGNVHVEGFASKRLPPGRYHAPRPDAALAPIGIEPTATGVDGTCLHTAPDGEPIGYLVGTPPVAIASSTRGWVSLAVDTPWGAITFAARETDDGFARCDPSVP